MIKIIQNFIGKLKRVKKIKSHYDFMPSHLALSLRPPSPFARITAISLSLTIIALLILTYFGKLDVQATATGRLVLSDRSQVIQSYEQSRVIDIHVKNGQKVTKGFPLLTLDTLGVNQDISRLSTQLEHLVNEQIKYQALLSEKLPTEDPLFSSLTEAQQTILNENYNSEKKEFEAAFATINAEIRVNQTSQSAKLNDINALKDLRHNIKQRLSARKTLIESKVIGKVEYLEQEKELLEIQRQISQQKAELSILVSQHDSLKERQSSFLTQKHREWLEKNRQTKLQLTALNQELSKEREREHLEIIRSPVDGTVQELGIYTLGAVLQPAQKLMIIVPNNVVQQAEIQILNKDAGFIYPGQKVTVKVDAFPYTRYGTIEADLVSISRDSTIDERLGLVFLAQIQLKKNNILIGNNAVELTPGMSVVAEIIIDKRRIIDYLLSPIQEYQSEALREH
ncbi:HlyD family type I secretion periplasmic adaptor subunit [Providencia rettgeri]